MMTGEAGVKALRASSALPIGLTLDGGRPF